MTTENDAGRGSYDHAESEADHEIVETKLRNSRIQYGLNVSRIMIWGGIAGALSDVLFWLVFRDYPVSLCGRRVAAHGHRRGPVSLPMP